MSCVKPVVTRPAATMIDKKSGTWPRSRNNKNDRNWSANARTQNAVTGDLCRLSCQAMLITPTQRPRLTMLMASSVRRSRIWDNGMAMDGGERCAEFTFTHGLPEMKA